MTRLDGIDVSHHQGPIDWHTAAASGIWWGATKATQSVAYTDPTLTVNRAGMAAVNLRHRGLYHWLSPASDPIVQARWFLTKIGRLDVGEFALLDAEEDGVTVSKVVQWCDTVEAATHRPCAVYTGAFVAGIWTDPRVRTSRYGRRPMALAAYTTEAKARALPGVKDHPWDSWQFTSTATVPGVSTKVDGNRIDSVGVYDLAAGRHLQPAPTFPTVLQEDDMRLLTNGEPRDIHDGHGPYAAGVVFYELDSDDAVTHIEGSPRGIAIVNARGGPTAAQKVSNVDLDALGAV